MKYIIGVLCVAYFPAHSFAEQLVDHTNTLIPSVPESIDGNNKYTQEKDKWTGAKSGTVLNFV
ncbi:hypothetical protein DKC18_007640 [Acinetobacter nosocomialis]|nr:hypothetical protein DKC18_007640 [Acinetobacter nosocomialis]